MNSPSFPSLGLIAEAFNIGFLFWPFAGVLRIAFLNCATLLPCSKTILRMGGFFVVCGNKFLRFSVQTEEKQHILFPTFIVGVLSHSSVYLHTVLETYGITVIRSITAKKELNNNKREQKAFLYHAQQNTIFINFYLWRPGLQRRCP